PRDGRQRDARQPRRQSLADDHRAGRAGDVAVAEQGRGGFTATPRVRIRAGRPGHAASSHRPCRRSGRVAPRRQESRRRTRVPVLSPNRGEEITMTELTTDAFRTLGASDAITEEFVVPYYLEDRKLRISVARVDGHLYAFDDLCTCAERSCPLSGGLL